MRASRSPEIPVDQRARELLLPARELEPVRARTVEGHLTSVFRTLQIDSRDELPAALAGGAPVPAA